MARKLVEEFVARYGIPREIHCDQGRDFESALCQEVYRLLGLDKARTLLLIPQSDGMVERFNRTLKAMLSLFVKENQRDWDCHLHLLLMAYRSAVHETTECTPSEIMLAVNYAYQLTSYTAVLNQPNVMVMQLAIELLRACAPVRS